MKKPKGSPVPRSRLARLAQLGTLAGGVAGGMLAEGLRQAARGNLPKPTDLIMTPANARRVAGKLAELRGAAMKVGQLLSMDAGDLLPPEFAALLAGLRADARPMPRQQVAQVMRNTLGAQWEGALRDFSFTPMAAASIGQVHAATTHEGRHLALKIQYPGVRQSIDSDVDNVATLLRISRLVPEQLALEPLLEEAKRQLHEEADYRREATCMEQFSKLLNGVPGFVIPRSAEEYSGENVLAMDLLSGEPVDSLVSAPQETRDRIVSLLIDLLFRELLDYRLVQTDPNFANFLFDRHTGDLGLLDFGATRRYPEHVAEAYRNLLQAALQADTATISDSAKRIGYFRQDIDARQLDSVTALFMLATEPARALGRFDFGATDLGSRLRDAGLSLSLDQGYWHTPPADAVFLHRKVAGIYLLAARLRARVDVRAVIDPFLSGSPAESAA